MEIRLLYSISMRNKEISSLKDFQMVSKLGEGSFAQVYKVKRIADDLYYAMKKIRTAKMKEKEVQNALNEIRILASNKNENIIQFKEAFYDEGSSSLCIVMQYASGGDILKLIHSFSKKNMKIPQQTIWKALLQISKGLNQLHQNRILHRDLKSANIFISSEGMFKIGDLNVSKVLKQSLTKTQTGTPYYTSPQICRRQAYDAKSDIWSLGCLLYEMAATKPPFLAKDMLSLQKKICSGCFPRISQQYSTELANMISKMLKVNPKERPSASQLISTSKKIKMFTQNEVKFISTQKINLMETIRFNTSKLKQINNFLPKPQYNKPSNKEALDTQNIQSKENIKLQSQQKKRILKTKENCDNYSSGDQNAVVKRQKIFSCRQRKSIISIRQKLNQIQLPLSVKNRQKRPSSIPKVQPLLRKLPQGTKLPPTSRSSKKKFQNLISRPSLLSQICQIKNNSRAGSILLKNLKTLKQQSNL